MKAVVDAQKMSKELKKLSPIIKKNSVIPILTSIKLSFEKGKVTIMATDLETTVLLSLECECKSPFVIIVEFSVLNDVCSRIFEPITIDASGKENIQITSDAAKFKFTKNNDEESFPKVNEEEFLLTIDADTDFFTALFSADFCKADDQFKNNMNAACIHIKKDSLTVVGTDAYVAYKKDLKVKTGKDLQVMVCAQFVQLVKGFANAKISIGEKFIKAESGTMVIISRLMDGKYCAYEMIMGKDTDYNLNINRADLITKLVIAGIAANPAAHLCVIHFNGGDIKITSQDIDYGKEGETKVKAIHTVEIKAIGVNGHQMLKLLNLFDSEEVEMAFRGATQTIFLRPAGEPNTMCLLQPLMIDTTNI
jgi:DNA polymerase-3 subunit beta